MSVSVTLNSLSYTIPNTGETGWGASVTAFIQAVGSSTLQKSGGTFTLTADADFGASYGLKASYFTSRTANAASAGAHRLARVDGIKWRNQANDADLTLGVDSTNNLEWEGVDLVTTTGTQSLSNKTLASPTFSGTASGSLTNLALTTPTITTSAWVTLTLAGTWVNYGAPYPTAAYKKMPDGRVCLRGAVKSGGATTIVSSWPAGTAPTGTCAFPVGSNGKIVFIIVSTSGMSVANSGTETYDNTEVILSGISWDTN